MAAQPERPGEGAAPPPPPAHLAPRRRATEEQEQADGGAKRRRHGHVRQGGTPDGRKCQCCRVEDTEADPVDLAVSQITQPISWGYQPRDGSVQQGKTCYYCFQVYQSRYRHKGTGLKDVVELLGSNEDEHKRFRGYRDALVAFFIEKGGRGCQVSWSDVDSRSVSIVKTSKTELCEADDQLWDYQYYLAQKGDPKTNGLGHVE